MMQATEISTKKIQRIGSETISDKILYKAIYKSIGVKRRFNKAWSPDYIRNHLVKKELIYHPFWIVKNLVVAARPPFPPKKTPNIIFIDAVSGYRGLFTKIPPLKNEEVEMDVLVTVQLPEEELDKYIKNVQQKQINRSYVLKKPHHEVKEVSLVYLPIWKAKIKGDQINETFYINGNSGESEKYMSERWKNRKDLLE